MKLKLNKKAVKTLQSKGLNTEQTQAIAGAGNQASVDICWTHPAYAACRMH
ncbi:MULTISPECIES: hypothetical protein [Pseudoalteromonas]|uniref:Uncharacterized protein n=1 Tax=Pseudoalteromonas rubra TaxID=43658 RepID=A0A8T0CDL1_9GAMM|nr:MULTISPECIES: hypothetical protein [Pseudoalteromonas]KAF7788630.1 hypothetical protein PRUB_a1645 [Pseudoalteromonas rubra]MCG7562038.1 hypothetical protein [Pseudoalteromonas sp. McH1-42]MEC4088357.1 hypothetical protein [Pseudoalteromonas rubra]